MIDPRSGAGFPKIICFKVPLETEHEAIKTDIAVAPNDTDSECQAIGTITYRLLQWDPSIKLVYVTVDNDAGPRILSPI